MEKWNPLLTSEELRHRYELFMKKYGNKFPPKTKNELKIHFIKRLGKYDNPTDFFQLYDCFGAVPDNINFYLYHLNEIKKVFGLDKNILEIAGGTYPTFGRRIASEQLKIGKGTITVYDPRLITTRIVRYPNLKLVNRYFTNEIDITKYNLLVGIMPCDATDNIVEAVEKYNKDFYIAFCGCGRNFKLSDDSISSPDYVSQIEDLKEICKYYKLGDLIIKYLPSNYNVSYPLVYNKRKS